MKYEIHFLNVGDADAIVIYYKADAQSEPIIVLVDAGNVGDGNKIKNFLYGHFGTGYINYAICTHPDKDHKGGFFELLEDDDIRINTLVLKDPCRYLSMKDVNWGLSKEESINRGHRVFNHPKNNGENLFDLAREKCECVWSIGDGDRLSGIPVEVVGPSEGYYREVTLDMVEDFTELRDEPNFEPYDELAIPSEEEVRSVIDEDDDESAVNKGSIMLLFTPGNQRFLLLGDATCASIEDAIRSHDLTKCVIKVPHHGSKHNMTTAIIDKLKPCSSVISAKGSMKHPNRGLVYWLSKYGNVYSTHKSGGLYYSSNPTTHPATPLRKKM